ncbi:AmmeMemoRadiSam system protein B [Rhodohalobacter sp. SW132]|uniref:AmmeMemoRadiSam system protein B n=1 Tax=Rhodohalobacter sp. SW132 TaxID=2293433 RepID=UPI000E269872|nr:AmmeMemoRadiSam system protein B [Rhodohalobacter sp. SW132]REL38180.1 AmmeMemoRadiSam system protein B [Rhodohalobacter sp. SW132]
MCLFTREEIKEKLNEASGNVQDSSNPTRIIFTPTSLNHYSIERFSEVYAQIHDGDFDTVVIVESQPGTHEKKLPMPSHKSFTTRFGEVPVNDKLRNELCDEDDDFFIDDEAFSKDLSLFDQLLFLQNQIDNFSVLSLQITDESPAIIKELSAALEEILASRNALLIFCCDIHHLGVEQFKTIKKQIKDGNIPGLMHSMNSGEVKMKGAGAFFAGLLIANKWNLNVQFSETKGEEIPISGYGKVQYQPVFG